MLRRGERGQAVIETAIMLPLFLLCLYGMLSLVAQGALSERAQLALRYAGIITESQFPYLKASLYDMYSTLDGIDPYPNPCIGVAANSAMLTANRAPFWQPVAGSITSSCWYQNSTALTSGPLYAYQFQNAFIRVTARSPINSFLTNGALSGQTSVITSASADYINTSTESFALSCSYAGGVIKSSLEAGSYQPPLDNLSNQGSWTGSTSAPLPVSPAPVFILVPYPLLCPSTFGPQAVHTPPPV